MNEGQPALALIERLEERIKFGFKLVLALLDYLEFQLIAM
jgi:hypothetical protein